jgi:hypothetical protein
LKREDWGSAHIEHRHKLSTPLYLVILMEEEEKKEKKYFLAIL